MAFPHTSSPKRAGKSPAVVIFLCFLAIVFDGYDLVVYGAIVPKLLAYEPWGLTPVETGAIGSYALAGMFIGAILIGYLTDVVGRRKVMMVSIASFSLLMLLTAWAPTPELFGLFRFLAGLGLGGVIPTAIALTVEFSQSNKRNFNNALMFSGYAVGGILAALLALAFLPTLGFRGMLALGGIPLVIVVPLLFKYLPESPAFLVAKGNRAEAERVVAEYGLELLPPAKVQGDAPEKGRFRTLLTGRLLGAMVLFCLAGICGQTLVYGLNTWLPQLMIIAKYSLASSLTFLLTVNIGAVVGVLVSSRLADRFGPRRVTAVSFASSGMALVLMGTGIMPLVAMYALVAVVGFGSVGAQILVNGFVATYFSGATRATALGITLGIGRIGAVLAISGGGVLVAAALGNFINFSVWAIAAAIGAIAVLTVPRPRDTETKGGAAGAPATSNTIHH
ncbi:MFS transporter [Pseudarthrobacter phenanthrenivorans]|uniref:MFS transporter n=2 Tax=Pseudarthrobacter phenanthrenivorans TaxID=361575 RepID=A0A3B0FTR1_PSEPS|nr:aromatic acid/H+ symport family MFS transporter [Pseudarthrobacter phenanthrenivorans]ADX75077.1 arabinose efflux permease family protein [Pseudarthrobacter phenanthrenivorans Sphe3]RKO21867.1 MFS transporter [Pseudarthrobacter phenanthrenivorans]